MYSRRDLNPHGRNAHWILSPTCLPIPPLEQTFQEKIPTRLNEIGILSGKRDSDPRPRPWQGRALPTELFPLIPNIQPKIWRCKCSIFFNFKEKMSKKIDCHIIAMSPKFF